MRAIKRIIAKSIFCLCLGVTGAAAQTTEFSYQGKLNDGALPANANYDFEFRLFSVESGGSAIGTLARLAVPVSNGIFTVKLDFGGQFDGTARWLEIAVKPAGNPNPFTVLSPRQSISSTPYGIRSLSSERADVATNSLQLGGVNANQYVVTTDPRMSDARNPLPNSANYVRNTAIQQSSSNFNISGNGTAGGTLSGNVVSAATQFNLGGNRILSNPGTNNLFAGVSAGFSNTTGSNNSFFGLAAGSDNTTGSNNSFFGTSAGINNTANNNSFFGSIAGSGNTSGINNSFFGRNAGNANSTGNGNSFFGNTAGGFSTGSANSFFGNASGSANTTGGANTFIGNAAGNTNTTGSNNTVIGAGADVGVNNLTFATAIGAGAVANDSNRIVLGRNIDGVTIPGFLRVENSLTVEGGASINFSALGSVPLCRVGSTLAACVSSLRYKTAVQPFNGGLNIVLRLRPITFAWKTDGHRDVGFGAEEVGNIEPLLVTYNDKGEVEGVKYAQITAVLVNAVTEQQAQIEGLREQIKRQQAIIDAIRKLLCSQDPAIGICGVQN